jgi:hypothetical membrane protein
MSLRAGVLVPVLYFGTILVSSLFYPGYSHVRQYASELGSASARHPAIFNTGMIAMGVAAIVSLIGFHAALRRLGANRVVIWLFLITLGAFGFSTIMAGLFPMPDPRHSGFGLGLAMLVSPALLAAALWRVPEMRALRIYLVATFIAALVLFAIMSGAGSLVRRSNVGAFQRTFALTGIPWIGIASWALLRRT